MPTYDYECRACGHVFETMHAMSAPALKKCPKCGKLKLVRLISGGAGVIFKGSGFYQTDYKAKRGGGEPKRSEADTSKSETKSDSKGETKSPPPSDKGSPKKDTPKKD
jgi:putative FmdB family regulatory protein